MKSPDQTSTTHASVSHGNNSLTGKEGAGKFDAIEILDDDDDDDVVKVSQAKKPKLSSTLPAPSNAGNVGIPGLKKLNTNAVSSLPSSGLAPIVGGAASFFGEAVVPKEVKSTPKKKAEFDETDGAANKKAKTSASPKNPTPKSKKENDEKNDQDNGALGGKKFVITGEFSVGGHTRYSIEELVKEHGGKIATSVSGKTDYLVIGDIPVMQNDVVVKTKKHEAAEEKNVKILSAEQFLAMIPAAAPEAAREPQWQSSFRKNAQASATSSSTSISSAAPLPSTTTLAFKPRPASSTLSSSGSAVGQSNKNDDDLMWVDKHKPKQMSDIIGSIDTVKNLQTWLRDWEAVHINKVKKVDYKPGNPGGKAVLLSGPPGIGKTTMATLIGKTLGYEVLELNASDTRNKRAISEELADVVLSKAIGFGGQMKKRMIIMDEVDGMGGSDRGGIPELIKVIKTSKTPIICICNDRHSVKIKSLAGHCFDLRVKRPPKQIIAKKLVEVALKEGLMVETNAAEMLAEQSGNDIRQALHLMQMWRAQATTMKYADLKNRFSTLEKDKVLRQSFFDATLEICRGGGSTRNMPTLEERYNSFFVDYSLIPLMVQQNYIKSFTGGFLCKSLDDAARLEVLSQASDAVADMELAEAGIRGMDQHWELLPACAGFTLRVGSIIQGAQGFPEFSAWMGKNSTRGRKHRLTQEIALHSMLSTGQGFGAVRLEYVPYLRTFLLTPLFEKGAQGIAEVIQLLDDYGLSKEDLSESLKDLTISLPSKDKVAGGFDSLEPSLKSALTRAYNSSAHRAQALVHAEGVSKKGKKSVAKDEFYGEFDAEEDLDGDHEDLSALKSDEPKEDVGDVSAFVKGIKKAKNDEKKSKAAANKKAKGK